MLAVTGDGTKLPPYVVFKRKTLPKNMKFPKGIIVRVHPKGWFDDAITKDWIRSVWRKRNGGLMKKKSLLVLDAFRCHRDENTKKMLNDSNTDLAIIPGGLTSILQPLDVSINKPFKCYMRELWNEWLDGSMGNQTTTATGRLRKPDLDVMCRWIVDAWKKIPQDMVIKSFKKCCITNALDGTEDNLIYESDTDDDSASDEPADEYAFNQLQVDVNTNNNSYHQLQNLFNCDDTDEEEEFFGF